MTVLYFSSTGNSLYIAKRIGGKLLSIPECIHIVIGLIFYSVMGMCIFTKRDTI